jgi:hypothetical protein
MNGINSGRMGVELLPVPSQTYYLNLPLRNMPSSSQVNNNASSKDAGYHSDAQAQAAEMSVVLCTAGCKSAMVVVAKADSIR